MTDVHGRRCEIRARDQDARVNEELAASCFIKCKLYHSSNYEIDLAPRHIWTCKLEYLRLSVLNVSFA